MKRLEQNYTFNAALGKITFLDLTQQNNPLTLSRVLLITNTNTNTIIYNFADPLKGGVVAGNVLTLDYSTAGMSNSDPLQIYYDFPNEDSFSLLPNTISTGQNVSTPGPGPWLDGSGFVSFVAQLTGSWTGTIIFETNNDASVSAFQTVVIDSNGVNTDPIIGNGIYIIPRTAQYFRYNVLNITGSVNFDIDGRSTAGGLSGIEQLANALDGSKNNPLNVVLPKPFYQDINGALIPSDAIPISWSSNSANQFIIIDTTGYESIMIHQQTAGIVTPTIGNDNIPANFQAVSGYLSSAPSVGITATAGAGVTVWPVSARYFKITGPATQVTAVIYLRQAPFQSSSFNLAQYGGTNAVNGGVAGVVNRAGSFGLTYSVMYPDGNTGSWTIEHMKPGDISKIGKKWAEI